MPVCDPTCFNRTGRRYDRRVVTRFGSSDRFDRSVLCGVGVFGIAILVLVLVVSPIRRIGRGETGDFVHFYYAGDAVLHGRDPYAAYTRGYIYPPLLSFLIQPVSALPIGTAAGVMLAVNVTITLVAVVILSIECCRRFGVPRSGFHVVTVAFWGLLLNVDKVKGEWQMWQTDVFMLLLLVLGLVWLDKRPWLAGCALGLAVNLKYLPLLFLPWMLVRRRFAAAAWLVAWSAVWAVLPAAGEGWTANARNWRTAVAGITNMTVDSPPVAGAAEVHGVADSLSCSITSAIARGSGQPLLAFAAAGGVAAILVALVAGLYRRHGRGLFDRTSDPAVIAGEWVLLVASVLALSPQTNTRHLFDATLPTVAAATLIFFARPKVSRVVVVTGCVVLVAGFLLPPGSRSRAGEWTPATQWLRLGGPCWCLLAAGVCVLKTSLDQSSAAE